ncbi:MAG TPA: L-threonine-O-3-phosphate decarboxylase [Parabacteroides sp.]|nr:L-threonine-O-3-phosphate decarboxylase [Parabacteroides sp.]
MLFGHGDDFYKSGKAVSSNYSSNVWYGADLEPLREHLFEAFDCLKSYPEPDAGSLRRLLAEKNHISPAEILVTNGSITAFYLIAQTWAGKHSAIFIPSFAEYEDACRLHGHRLTFFKNLSPLSGLSLKGVDLCWICNPNNPDGKLIQRPDMLEWVEGHPDTLFVIDQVYADFCMEHLLDLEDIHRHPNLILIQSISKLHKIPGARIGYVAASEELIASIQARLIPWSVNSLAVEAGKYTLLHPELFALPLRQWLDEARRLQRRIGELGVDVYPSSVPFFLNKLPRGMSAGRLKAFLWERGILIRDASNFRGLDSSYFRLSTQSPEENDRLVETLRDYMERGGCL